MLQKITEFLRTFGAWVVSGIFLVAALVFFIQSCNRGKQRDVAITQRDSCIHAPMTTDTIHTFIYLPGKVTVKKYLVRQVIHDTVVRLVTTWYDSTYSGNGWRFRWHTQVSGTMDEITFADFVVPKEIIIKTKTVDTCYAKLPAYYPKSHWWAWGKTSVIFTPSVYLPDFTAGAAYTFKDKWGIGLGVGYDWNVRSPKIEGMFLWNIK